MGYEIQQKNAFKNKYAYKSSSQSYFAIIASVLLGCKWIHNLCSKTIQSK